MKYLDWHCYMAATQLTKNVDVMLDYLLLHTLMRILGFLITPMELNSVLLKIKAF